MSAPLPLALARLYEEHGRVFAGLAPACRPCCSLCCTDHVPATSLEADALADAILGSGREGLRAKVQAAAGRNLYRPAVTINGLARLCLARREPPGEPEAEVSVCPLLEDGLCAFYSLRPLACRAEASITPCRPGGEAETDEMSLTLNQVFFQAAEHLDPQGVSGNLIDLLSARMGGPGKEHLIKNEPVPGLLAPPGHRARAEALLRRLLEEPT